MLARVHNLVLTALLALSLVVSGQTVASAKGASPATGQMVLCIGMGSVVVFTDADGQPTAAPHICPDCMLASLIGLVAPEIFLGHMDLPQDQVTWRFEGTRAVRHETAAAQARAPPLTV